MSFDFQRSMHSLYPYGHSGYPYDISKRNILEIYNDAWDTCEYFDNKSIIRSCEQELIKLDKIELQDFLQQFVSKPLPFSTIFTMNEQTVGIYTSCVLLQLIYVFCIPGQEEKIKLVKVNINKILHTWTERSRYFIYERYLSQRLKAKSNLTDKDLLTGQIDPQHELELKLYYWAMFCDNGDCKEFLQQNIDYLVSNIERSIQEENLQEEKYNGYWAHLSLKNDYIRCNGIIRRNGFKTKTKHEFCKVLLCLLNICDQKSTLTQSKIHNSEIHASPSFQSEEEGTTKNPCTVYKVRCVLENLLSTLAEDEISQVFNDYIYQMYAMQSEITPDGLFIGETDSCHEFKLKLCYWKTICRERDYETYKKFIQLYPEFLVSHIEDVVQKNEKWKTFSPCTTLLCILNWNVYYQKTSNPLNFQDCSFTSEVHNTTKCQYTADKVRSILQKLLLILSEDKIHTTFNDYLEQINTMRSEITEDDLCTGKIKPYHEFLLKLCYYEKLWNENDDDEILEEFLRRNADLFVSQIEEVIHRKNTKTKLAFCKILLCLLNWNICNLKTTFLQSTIQNSAIQESCSIQYEEDNTTKNSCTVYKVRCVLQNLLSTLTDDEISKMYVIEPEEYDGVLMPWLRLGCENPLKICFLKKNITRNAQLFQKMVEEVNKGNQLIMKLKMCQVSNILMNGDIYLTKYMFTSISNEFELDAHVILKLETYLKRATNHLSILNIGDNEVYVYRIIASILHLKSKLDNIIEPEKIPIQYQDHIKELLLSLLADMLTLLSAQQIHDAFSLLDCFNQPFAFALNPITNSMLPLAKNFLDIYVSSKISQHKKSIIKDKIQPIISSHEYSKTAFPPTTEFELTEFELTDSTKKFLDHKGIINICINVVKTESRFDINIPMYEGSFCTERKAIENEFEMIKRSQETETLVLLMLLLITITSTGHHKSAKLKKYLSLKYEYATASLYLLWCSGDIEVHPGPSLNKKTLAHDSSIERRWIQNISPKIINRLPEHEQSKIKPTKVRNDSENKEHFKSLLKTCQEEKVHVPKMYLAEINAGETMEYTILHKLFVYRCEIETIIASLQDFFICGGSTKDLTDINVSFDTELKTNDITAILGKDHRPTDKSQLIVYITGHIAGIAIKCAHGKDPDAKCDGLWDQPLKHWPKHIILFDPNNRGKYIKKHPGQKLISDQDLVDMLLTLPQVIIPKKYKEIVNAFRIMRKSQKDKSINKKHKAELCSTFKRITSLEKLDYALKNLWESGIFTEEVHNNLNKWWTTGAVDTTDINQNLSQVNIKDAEKKRRPHILMNISTKSITLTVEQSDANSSQVSYDFPFSDECVPLKTMATIVHQTTIHKPSSDSYQKVTAEKYLTDSPKQDACLADNQINLIIIPPEALRVLNTYFPCDIYPDSQAILENDIKHQHEMSSQELALCSIHFDQQTFSTNQFSQWNQNIAIFGQPGHILCTPNQSTTNLNDISSATKDSQNPDFYMQVSPTSDMGSSDSISSVNSGNEEKDQNSTSNGDQGQDQLTDSDYSSDSSNNCVSKTSLKKRKCIEEDRIDMKKRKIPSLKQDKKQSETTSHRKIDSSMDNSTTCNKDMELLLDYLDIDLDSFDIDDQTFEVEMNALDNEDKNLQVCDKDRNLMNDEIQMSNKNTTVSAYDTNVSSDLEMFLQEMICGESEKMLQMKSYLSDV